MGEGLGESPDILHRTFELGRRVDALCRHLRALKLVPAHRISQLERSGSAVGALAEEAQAAESKQDFIHKMSIALKEARETFYWLRQLMAAKLLPEARLADLTDEARQVKLVLAAIINTARRNLEQDSNKERERSKEGERSADESDGPQTPEPPDSKDESN